MGETHLDGLKLPSAMTQALEEGTWNATGKRREFVRIANGNVIPGALDPARSVLIGELGYD